MLVLDAGELLEFSMSFIDEMHLLEMGTLELLFLRITGCEDLELLRVSAPRLKEITYHNNPAFIHDPLPCVWRLEVQLITHMKEEDDDNNEYSIEDDDNDNDGSNIYNLLRHYNSSVRCLLVHL
ncbi:unnamed protein product [Miscanthus lutarioriparius]|uniref:Uncharacterized protein n=1 Tax=Miscanthus lutarioriparius TaxID=422564 RepID=A0A811NZL1_9POAL|nr:unnamed protein product [Miscanthus lutarioriparius]